MKRWWIRTAIVGSVGLAIALSAAMAGGGDRSSKSGLASPGIAQLAAGVNQTPRAGLARGSFSKTTFSDPIVIVNDHHDTSLPLSVMASLPIVVPPVQVVREMEVPPRLAPGPVRDDPVRQHYRGAGPKMPAPVVNIDGVINTETACSNCFPPDTEGDVGPDHYFQWVNTAFKIFNKAGGLVMGPTAGNTIWSGFGGLCETTNRGDPIVLYDRAAGRWFVSQFAFNVDGGGTPMPPYVQCNAVSTTNNPTGTYNRYDFTMPGGASALFNDYAKVGVWPDAYYMSINQFGPYPSLPFAGWGGLAFERDKMIAGLSAQAVYFNTGQGYLPVATDLDGATAPPLGADGLFFDWNNGSSLARWNMNVDWVTPASSTLTGPVFFAVALMDLTVTNAPQPGTAVQLDSIMDRLMYRNAYRNFGTHESVVLNQTVRVAPGQVGVRWYELRTPHAGVPTVFQQGTYAGDAANTDSRWMGSIAMDGDGDIALGYSVSGAGTFPGIRYVGRLAGDGLGTLPQGETTLVAGAGSQTGQFAFNLGRWGDYSMMGIDPIDDCTFWYTQQWQLVTAGVAWRTRIGSFKFPNCAVPTAVEVIGFTARATRRSVALSWSTRSEANVLGFNVWRTVGKKTVKVNARLIPAKQSGRAAGAAYRLVDRSIDARQTYGYRLQLVTLKGARSWSSGISVATR